MKKAAFFVFGILCSIIANAQQNQQQYGSGNNGQYVYYTAHSKRTDNISQYRQLLKVCPLWLLEGNVPIFYERKVGNKVTIEPSVGLTFNNYVWEVFEQGGVYNGGAIPVSTRYYKPSFSAGVALKFYPSGAFNGFYISPELRYRNYQSQALNNTVTNNPGTPSTNPSNYSQESLTFTDFKFVFGYMTFIGDVVPIEFFWGLGARQRNETRFYDNTSINNGYGTTVNYGLITYNKFVPVFSTGIKIGIGFK